jgi:hypothetical protein
MNKINLKDIFEISSSISSKMKKEENINFEVQKNNR